MTLRQELIKSIETINPGYLSQIFNLAESLKKTDIENHGKLKEKIHPLARFIGSINDIEAERMLMLINKEFSQIEGDW